MKGSIDMDIINAFEDKIFGFCLPKSYKEIISEHDGLRLVENSFVAKFMDMLYEYKDEW